MYYINESEVSLNSKHHTYKIKKGDTLQSVALELGVDAQELRRYHNIYCEIPNLIEADFKSHLKLVILAPEKSIASKDEVIEEKPEKVSFGDNYKLPFLPSNTEKEYQVQCTIEVGDEIDIIEMEISVKWIASDKNGFHLFEINRKSILINNKLPDTVMAELAAKTAETLYPLKIVVDASGKWIDIYNYNEIVNRWIDIKTEILDYYEGEVTQNYIDHTDYTLESSATLLKSLASDYFLRAFFNGIHVAYTTDYSFKNTVSFPLEKSKEAVYNVEQKVTPYLDEDGLIKVEQKGDYIDSSFDIDFGVEPWKGNYSAAYFLGSYSYCIEKMNLECNSNYNNPIKIAIKIDSIIQTNN